MSEDYADDEEYYDEWDDYNIEDEEDFWTEMDDEEDESDYYEDDE